MKIIVFSDSHGLYNNMIDIVKNEAPDMIIHCGDYERDVRALEVKFRDIQIHSVEGNCDFASGGRTEEEFTVLGRKFYITHGHLQRVKGGYMNLIYTGKEKFADVVICGHTHVPLYEEYEGMSIINPGSITFGAKTYGIIEMDETSFNYTAKALEPGKRHRGRR